MSELVEKVARAICRHAWQGSSLVDAEGLASGTIDPKYYDEAQAALSAIEAAGMVVVPREPTTRQLAAGQTAWLADPLKRSSTLYRAMIAAAKGEG